jgi:hypothetical protein
MWRKVQNSLDLALNINGANKLPPQKAEEIKSNKDERTRIYF